MRYHFYRTANTDFISAEFILKPRIDALAHRLRLISFLWAQSNCGVGLSGNTLGSCDGFLVPRRGWTGDDGHVMERAAVGMNGAGVAGRIHQFIKMGHALPGHGHERNGGL